MSKDQLTPEITKTLSAKWIRVLESDLNNKENLNLYNKYKLKLELIYDHIAEGNENKIWLVQAGEKINKIFSKFIKTARYPKQFTEVYCQW